MRGSLFVCALCAACGSASSRPTTPSEDTSPKASPPALPAPSTSSSASSAAPAAGSSPAEEAYDDPAEIHDPATLAPLFEKGAPPSFPKGTTGERECWQTVSLTGDAKKDFDALVARCGTPTGAIEYVKPAIGKLHYTKDKRDTFMVKVHGGYCYRFFGVADGTINDLDILIQKKNGDLVGSDNTSGPVAIIEPDKAWCMDRDDDYQFKVEIDGTGVGNYAFGVWARHK
jgi:hypothetical protein